MPGFLARALTGHLSQTSIIYKAVLLDAAGTLISPSENTADVYVRIAKQHSVVLCRKEVLVRYRR